MSRAVVVFYIALAVWLAGFAVAAVTAGAPAAVVVGSLGLLGTIAAAAARITADNGPEGHRGRWLR